MDKQNLVVKSLYNMYCKRCKEETTHYYNGFQEGLEELSGYYVFTCSICEDTFSIYEGELEKKVKQVNIK